MDFELTRQQKLSRKIAREFAERELAPYAQQWDEEMTFPAEAIKKMGPLGFMGISIPKEYEGAGLDGISYVPHHRGTGPLLRFNRHYRLGA